jgi:hypothetical protein
VRLVSLLPFIFEQSFPLFLYAHMKLGYINSTCRVHACIYMDGIIFLWLACHDDLKAWGWVQYCSYGWRNMWWSMPSIFFSTSNVIIMLMTHIISMVQLDQTAGTIEIKTATWMNQINLSWKMCYCCSKLKLITYDSTVSCTGNSSSRLIKQVINNRLTDWSNFFTSMNYIVHVSLDI